MPEKVLVVAAHLDDEVLGVGGTIARYGNEGNDVVVLNICNRSTFHKPDPVLVSTLRCQAAKVQRELGISRYIYADLQDEYLDYLLVKVIEPIEQTIADFKPNIIYTHHQHDVNQDHRAVFAATLVATRSFAFPSIHSIYSYEVLSSSEQAPIGMQFQPDHFVDVSSHLLQKQKAMSFYEQEIREFPFPRCAKGIETLANYRGMMVGLKCAEAFKTIRTVRR